MVADPTERVNVIGKKENASVLVDLSRKLLAHMKKSDDPQTQAFEAALSAINK